MVYMSREGLKVVSVVPGFPATSRAEAGKARMQAIVEQFTDSMKLGTMNI